VHFLEDGIGSVVAISSGDESIEVCNVGREGMVGTAVILGADRTPLLTFMQVAGSAFRLRSDILREAMESSCSLRRLLCLYMQSVAIQTAHTALANSRYTIPERLARWLLMNQDRSHGNDLLLTHDFLALMLGVRRAGITVHLHVLEGERIIKATRGNIRILDRSKLQEVAGDCYGLPEAEYARLIGSAKNGLERIASDLRSQAASFPAAGDRPDNNPSVSGLMPDGASGQVARIMNPPGLPVRRMPRPFPDRAHHHAAEQPRG
jgi:CRP-like cAMP-binding protein